VKVDVTADVKKQRRDGSSYDAKTRSPAPRFPVALQIDACMSHIVDNTRDSAHGRSA